MSPEVGIVVSLPLKQSSKEDRKACKRVHWHDSSLDYFSQGLVMGILWFFYILFKSKDRSFLKFLFRLDFYMIPRGLLSFWKEFLFFNFHVKLVKAGDDTSSKDSETLEIAAKHSTVLFAESGNKVNLFGGSVAEWFGALDLKSGGPCFKSSTLLLSLFVLGRPEFNSSTALCK